MSREETITTTAEERRLGAALMWMGALLGALFIALLGLGFGYWNATINRDNAHSVPRLEEENIKLSTQLGSAAAATQKATDDLKSLQDKDGKYIQYLQEEYRKSHSGRPPPPTPPMVFDPTRAP